MTSLARVLVYSFYLMRRNAKEEHEDAMSNAVFFSAAFLMVGLMPALIWIGKLTGLEFLWQEFAGVSGGKWVAILVATSLWLYLKMKVSGVSESDVYQVVEQSPALSRHSKLIALSPLIFAVAVWLLYLMF